MIPWTRIEPDNEDPSLQEGLRAEVADPLWLLARQWQMGEFRGEDVGTPVLATVETAEDPPQVLVAGGKVRVLDGTEPIETLIERESEGPPDDALRLQGAMVFAELMAAANLTAIAEKCVALFALPADADGNAEADPDTAAVRAALAGRAVDAEALFEALRSSVDDVSSRLDVPAAQKAAFTGAAASWIDWYGARRGVGGGLAWSEGDASHHAAVRTVAGAELRIAGHRGGVLDWSAFDARQPMDRAPEARKQATLIPLPIQIPGTGSIRFWEMEDAQVDLGTLAAGSTEIARALLGEFALLWAHDWFVVPVPVASNTWTAVPRIVVRDTFGVETVIPPAVADGRFGLWRHQGLVCGAASLWVPASAPVGGSEVERLDLIVDEGSNMRWAHEARLRTGLGLALDPSPPRAAEQATPASASWRYQPFTPPPPGFVPLVVRDGRIEQAELVLGDLPIPALKTPLAQSLSLRADLLRTEGLSITRRWEVARSGDGRLIAWIARRRSDQPPLTTAALVFDALQR
jgi:hypothetical protein